MVSLTPDTGDQKPPRPPLVQSPGDTPPTGGPLTSAASIFTTPWVQQMPGWARSGPCSGTWLPKGPALG